MIREMGRQAIAMRKIEDQRPKLKEQWCPEQQRDIERLFEMVEELVEKAVNSQSSPLAYQLLQQGKADFIREFLDTSSKYRMIDDPENYRKEVRSY